MVNENKIKCPKCGNEIELSDSEYALILKQVRDESFDREVNEKVALAVKVAKIDVEKIKDEEISELKNKLSLSEKDKELAVQSSISEKDKIILNKDMEINELKNEIKMTEQELKNKYEYIIERIAIKKDNPISNTLAYFKMTKIYKVELNDELNALRMFDKLKEELESLYKFAGVDFLIKVEYLSKLLNDTDFAKKIKIKIKEKIKRDEDEIW